MEKYLVDGHVHLENGDLSVEYILEFVKAAKKKNLNEIHILDHSHRFKEFKNCYDELKGIDVQKEWLENKQKKFKDSLSDYINLIEIVRKLNLGINIKFGLEVCYTPNSEGLIRDVLKDYQFDFLNGSIHSIDGILFDMPFSKEILWDKYDIDYLYCRYYKLTKQLIESNLFTVLSHPDQVKISGLMPNFDLKSTYDELACLLRKNDIMCESNTGAHYRYNIKEIGTNVKMLRAMISNDVKIITSSDAHRPQDVGNYILEAQKIINNLFSISE